MAYLWQDSPGGPTQIVLANADGSQPRTVHTDGLQERQRQPTLAWSPDGGMMQLTMYDAIAEKEITGTGTEAEVTSRITWSPQGEQIVMAIVWPGFGGSAPTFNIIAWLPEKDASPTGSLQVGEFAILDSSTAGMSAVGEPAWQPRPP